MRIQPPDDRPVPIAPSARRQKLHRARDGTRILPVGGKKVRLPARREPFHGFRREITGNFQERCYKNYNEGCPVMDYAETAGDVATCRGSGHAADAL